MKFRRRSQAMFYVSAASRLSVAFSPPLPLLSFAFGPITSYEMQAPAADN